jgi:hypothetical protein
MKNTKTVLLAAGAIIVFQLFSSPLFAQTESNGPKVEGSKNIEPDLNNNASKTEAAQQKLKQQIKFAKSPAKSAVVPKSKTRGRDVDGNCGGAGYQGKCSIYQFTNIDFPISKTSCGQAAACTALWAVGMGPRWNNDKVEFMRSYWRHAPPKITIAGVKDLGGNLGTDWRQINYGLDGYKSYGVQYSWQSGRANLEKYLRMGWPCIIMLDCGTLAQYNYAWMTGHWVVAYGYDANGFYVTNFPNNYITWTELNKAWGGVLTEGQMAKAHGTGGMFCVVWK